MSFLHLFAMVCFFQADLYNDKMESVGLRDILQVSTQYR